jgi:hypothetical protein
MAKQSSHKKRTATARRENAKALNYPGYTRMGDELGKASDI